MSISTPEGLLRVSGSHNTAENLTGCYANWTSLSRRFLADYRSRPEAIAEFQIEMVGTSSLTSTASPAAFALSERNEADRSKYGGGENPAYY